MKCQRLKKQYKNIFLPPQESRNLEHKKKTKSYSLIHEFILLPGQIFVFKTHCQNRSTDFPT